MKIKDSHVREGNSKIHPFMEPYLVHNDKDGCPTLYFESKYDDMQFCIKTWGVAPFELRTLNPHLYYYPEKPENKIIVIKKGSYARIPHGFYICSTLDGSPATYTVRSINQL